MRMCARACMRVCALMGDGERDDEIDLMGYNCQDSAVTILIDFSSRSHAQARPLSLAALLSHVAPSTSTASRFCPDQRELGTDLAPCASNDRILTIPSLLVFSSDFKLTISSESPWAHVGKEGPFHQQWLPVGAHSRWSCPCGKRPRWPQPPATRLQGHCSGRCLFLRNARGFLFRGSSGIFSQECGAPRLLACSSWVPFPHRSCHSYPCPSKSQSWAQGPQTHL